MSETDKKTDKGPLARRPRGFEDRNAAEIVATRKMLDTIQKVYELYGFEPVETPMVEYTDALGKFLPDQDRPNEGVFSFQDDDEQWLSLRYDLTAPLARYVAENYDKLAKPYRSYRSGWVFRNEKPGPGRFRQFMQFDADTVGTASPAADAEIAMMAADAMEALGIARGDYVIRINNRKVLDGVLEAIGLGGDENAGRRLTVLRSIDKLDKFGLDAVEALLGDGRVDESGDRTVGAKLDKTQISRVMEFICAMTSMPALKDDDFSADAMRIHAKDAVEPMVISLSGLIERFKDYFGDSPKALEGVEELYAIAQLSAASGYNDGRIVIDTTVVRGLEYYTGPVFEAELTFEVKDEDGRPTRFGSVGGGGRYDGLVSRFRGETVPATGFSIGVSRLAAALRALGRLEEDRLKGPVVVTVMDRERLADYQAMVAILRAAGIRAELYLGSSGMKPQLKYADRRNAPAVIIQGSDEKARGEVTIKDLAAGAEAAKAIATNAEWRESRPAQVTVKLADMVATIRAIVDRA